MTEKRPPRRLETAGQRLWKETLADFELDPAEEAILLQMARLSDDLARMNAELAGAPATIPGSRGQMIVNPLFAEIRLTSLALAKLAKQLNLPQPRVTGGRRGRLSSVQHIDRKDV